MNRLQRQILLTILLLGMGPVAFSQQPALKEIGDAIELKDIRKAEQLLDRRIKYFTENGMTDSLSECVTYVGRLAALKTNNDDALREVDKFLRKIQSLKADASALKQAKVNAAEFYSSIGKNELAYKTCLQAYDHALAVTGIEPDILAHIDSDLGTYAYRMGNIKLSETYHRKAIEVYLRAAQPDYDRLYVAGNNMGSIMWFASKTDSALYYFNIALTALLKTEPNPQNQYYRPAVLQNNLSALYSMQGKTSDAIAAMKSTIENLKNYLAIKGDLPKKETARVFQFEAIDNLGVIYKGLGDYSQALQLQLYSYQQKQKYLDTGDPAIFISQILLGQVYLARKEHDKAEAFLNQGLRNISLADGDYLFWQADACYALALLNNEKGNKKAAAEYYEKADSLYETTLQGSYDDIYLDFSRNASLFYAGNNNLNIALQKSNKVYNYIIATQGAETLPAFHQQLNLSRVYFLSGNYSKALQYADQALHVVNKSIATATHFIDSVKMELQKPAAMLVRTKARYEMLKKKDLASISPLLNEMQEALGILEKRKEIIADPKDVGLMMDDHRELLDFVKKLNLELHRETQQQGYIDRIIELHESGIYHRVRSRLDKSDSLRFANIPSDVLKKETSLKQSVSDALKNAGESSGMQAYFSALDEWNSYLEMIRRNYPRYYEMRFATIFRSLDEISKTMPQNLTVVRYFFVEDDLYAVVLDKKGKNFVALDVEHLEENIEAFSRSHRESSGITKLLHALYVQLWQPLEAFVHNRKVSIIPDGMLYNLSFELLTPTVISNYRELAINSLLAKHSISYHFSLYLIGNQSAADSGNDNFVAFAPGFMDEEKDLYRSSIKDSSELDPFYLTLLPQPLTLQLASDAGHLMNGVTFLRKESTVENFISLAGDHRIIHLGTHAEANNLFPEYSRLIFSKTTPGQSHSIYLPEIYSCNLNADLAVLTACETGMPGYEDGEGMISLAHAFNYAGSKSILTGLWKIDEKASAIIVKTFYEKLVEGYEKDEALRLAKLDYLSTAQGRMLEPRYWAGLVLMGDTEAVQIHKKSLTWPWIAGSLLILLTAATLVYRRRRA